MLSRPATDRWRNVRHFDNDSVIIGRWLGDKERKSGYT